jgi:Homing endonuclease associated repeat
MKTQPNRQFILDSLAAMARGAGRPPSRREFLSRSEISEYAVIKLFPSWNAALEAAGLAPYTRNVRLEDQELLADWGQTVRRNRGVPTCRAYHQLGRFGLRTIENRFGAWSQVPEVFRRFAQGKRKWADVLALLPAPAPKPSPQRGRNPVPNTLASRAVAPAFLPERLSPSNKNCPVPSKIRYRTLHGRPTYGQPTDFRGLRHEPVNEQGVMLLFGMVAKELGYIVEAVQSGFPDCEAKRQIGSDRWQRVQIEFEFESRNFRDHGHPFTGCDIIVCWRHNWPDCPHHLEILELSSLLKSLPHSET